MSEDSIATIEATIATPRRHVRALMAKCGVKTNKELINHSLAMLERAVELSESGHKIALVNYARGVYRDLQKPILRYARASWHRVSGETSTGPVKFLLPAATLQHLELLMAKCGIKTWEELFSKSLKLLERAVALYEQGWQNASINGVRIRANTMHILQHAAKNGRRNLIKLKHSV